MSEAASTRQARRRAAPRRTAPHAHKTGPRAVEASDTARRTGAVILEALAGLRTTQDAADALGVALPRYYVLETRALAGLVAALEPRARGRQRGAAERISELEAEVQRLEREARRYQALQRASQRALGLAAAVAPPIRPKGKGATGADKAKRVAAAEGASAAAPKRRRGPRKRPRGAALARGLVRARVLGDPSAVADAGAADPRASSTAS